MVHSPWESVTSFFGYGPGSDPTPTSTSSASSTSVIPRKKINSGPSSKLEAWTATISRDPILVGILSAVGATTLTLGGIAGYRLYWRRIRNSDYVTSGMLNRKKWVKGVVTR